jgi:hypothetical protein
MSIFIVGMVIGLIAGWMLLRALINHKLKIMLDSIANSPVDEYKKIDLDFIKKDDIIYCYNRDGDVFLAWGTTKQEIMDVLSKKFPGTRFMARPDNLKEVGLEAAE